MKVSSDPAFLKNLFTTEVYSISTTAGYTENHATESIVEETPPPTESKSGVVVFLSSDPDATENALLGKILSSIGLSTDKITIRVQTSSKLTP